MLEEFTDGEARAIMMMTAPRPTHMYFGRLNSKEKDRVILATYVGANMVARRYMTNEQFFSIMREPVMEQAVVLHAVCREELDQSMTMHLLIATNYEVPKPLLAGRTSCMCEDQAHSRYLMHLGSVTRSVADRRWKNDPLSEAESMMKAVLGGQGQLVVTTLT